VPALPFRSIRTRKEFPPMTGPRTRRLLVLPLGLLAVLACAVLASPAMACPFCGMQGQTLTQEVNQASMVLYGTLANPQQKGNPLAEVVEGTTDLILEKVIKSHKLIQGKKVVTLPRYVPVVGKDKVKFLIFCEVIQDKIDPYRGMPIKGSDMPTYLEGALKVKDAPLGKKLRFFFDYLQNDDLEIANDALKEFGNADYKDYADMARTLPGDKVAAWLQNKDGKTQPYRIGLYASMLGHCSTNKARDAKLLRSLVEDPEKRVSSGVDGILAGYILLQPKEGFQYTRSLLKDPKNEFLLRYAALRTVRFFHDSREDVVPRKDVIEASTLLLDQPDIADLAIEDLRKWKCWELTGRILGLKNKESHDVPIIHRSILRFALCSPDKQAARYVEQIRKEDPEMVSNAEELLKLEQAKPQTPPASPTPPTPPAK
jgi:hypothetical protein